MLTTNEAAVYDRQIRLWGLSGQFAIKNARTLVIGLTPSSVEICKNLILAGSNLLILDSIGDSPNSFNFLTRLENVSDDSGSLAERTASALRGLNPMATIQVVSCVDENLFNVAVVSLNVYSKEETAKLVTPCLIATLESERGTFSFISCNGHIVIETSKPTEKNLPACISCISFSELISLNPPPTAGRKEVKLWRESLEWLTSGRDEGRHGEVASAAVAAITGGLIAEECLKIFTKKDFPLLNTITVDGESCSASVKIFGDCGIEFRGKQVEDDDVKVVGSEALEI